MNKFYYALKSLFDSGSSYDIGYIIGWVLVNILFYFLIFICMKYGVKLVKSKEKESDILDTDF